MHLLYPTLWVAVILAALAMIWLLVTRPRTRTYGCGNEACLCNAGPSELHGADPYTYARPAGRHARR